MSESGSSRQIELTPFRMRVGLALAAVIVGLAIFAIVGLAGLLSKMGSSTSPDDALAQKVQSLQQELKKKDLAVAAQEKRLMELQESPAPAGGGSRRTKEIATANAGAHGQEPAPANDGPLAALQDAVKSPSSAPAESKGTAEKTGRGSSTFSSEPHAEESPGQSLPEQRPESREGTVERTEQAPIVNFNAQDVTAYVGGRNSGKLSFRLIKDHPDTMFSGYVFVFVETVDQSGKSRIVVYPSKTRLSDGYLPIDYKEGQPIPFKVNARVRVDLPDEDISPAASLSRVSILLYDADGKIVFQRGFDRKELKVVGNRAGNTGNARTRAGQKRRAL